MKFHMRSTNCPKEVFDSVDEVINNTLLPALTGRAFENAQPETALLALPARFGGLAIPVMSTIVLNEYSTSRRITQPIADLIASGTATAMLCNSSGHQESYDVIDTSPAVVAVGDSRKQAKAEPSCGETSH